MPLIIDMSPAKYSLTDLGPVIRQAAARTGLIAIVDFNDWPIQEPEQQQYLPHVAFYLDSAAAEPPKEMLRKTPLVEIADDDNVTGRIKKLKGIHPDIVVAVRVELNSRGPGRAVELAGFEEVLQQSDDKQGHPATMNANLGSQSRHIQPGELGEQRLQTGRIKQFEL